MRSLKWNISHAVFVTEIDDEHREIFEQVSALQKALSSPSPSPRVHELTRRLITCIADHFAHEERLMRAARYGSMDWHKQGHNSARRRAAQLASRIEQGDPGAGIALVEYLTSWLRDHSRLADRMLGAFLRNQRLGLCKVTFQAGTKPKDACAWVDANGDRLKAITN